MNELYEKIYAAVMTIPCGKVATYAQVAAMVGNPRLCRVVGNALHINPYFGEVPCHRVVSAQGRLSGEFAFVTGVISEGEYEEKAEKLGTVISRIRVRHLHA